MHLAHYIQIVSRAQYCCCALTILPSRPSSCVTRSRCGTIPIAPSTNQPRPRTNLRDTRPVHRVPRKTGAFSDHRSDRSPLVDTLGRPMGDLRISVTDRCNLRCTYCMPYTTFRPGYAFLPSRDLLDFDQICRITTVVAEQGVRKVRITGGEPLLRPKLPELVSKLASIGAISDIALTTNGLLLERMASQLHSAGLHRITVSLDAVDDDAYRAMNGLGVEVGVALRGIDAAVEAGFDPVKINVVVQRGVNENQILPLVERFRGTGCVLRFIEYMDTGNCNGWREDQVVPSTEVIARISAKYPLRPLGEQYRGEVAARYAFADGAGEIGVISSVSAPFCGDCTRARLTADGKLVTCLFGTTGIDLRQALRSSATDDELRKVIADAWRARADRYSETRAELRCSAPAGPKIEMHKIGG